MNRSDPKQSVRELLEEAHPALIGLSHWIHANPEVGFEEHHASDWVNEWLQTAGFDIERGVADMPTALVGRFGPGPFHVAICVEYDALPEVGHACGHNIIAAAGVGAGLALASVADELGLRVSVMGTPAEESGGGKLAFIEAGLFGDVHAAAMVHPWPADVVTPNIIAITQLDVTYRGHEAHAAGFPHLGRNAADALVVAQTAIGLLRQQLLPTDRVHGIVTKGGDAPNIIPALTTAKFMVRALDAARLEEVTQLVRRCFEAGALATGTEVEVVEGTRYSNMAHDADLAALYRHNGEQLGRVFDDAPGAPVSTDMGDVSHVVPSIHPMIGIEANGAVNHQREFTDACATASADQAILDGALGLAWTVIDAAQNQVIRARLMGEADIREAVLMVEEVQELDAHADVLDDLAASMVDADPELAERIAAAADALESRADELADEADSRFERAQELADEALLDEVTGELESDVEDLAAAADEPSVLVVEVGSEPVEAVTGDGALTETHIVELLAVADLADALDASPEAAAGIWQPAPAAEETPEVVTEATVESDVWAQAPAVDAVAQPTDLANDLAADGAPEPFEAMVEPTWQEDAVAEAVEPTAQADEASEPVATDLGQAHAAWERDFLVIVRHAAWEEEFSGALSSVAPASEDAAAEPALDAVAEQAEPAASEDAAAEPALDALAEQAEPAAEAALDAVAEQAEPAAEAALPAEPAAEPALDAVGEAALDADSELEADSQLDADSEPLASFEPSPFAGFELRAELGRSWDEQFEAIADDGTEFHGELDEIVTLGELDGDAAADSAPAEVVADATGAWRPETDVETSLEAVATQSQPVATAGDAWESTGEAPMAQAEPGAFVTTDDIWYSGAPDDQLPAAELVGGTPVGVAASNERADEFVWVPADEDH
ncbi:MAG: amidohydrolase [Chloroflexota bacterium]